ARDGTQIARWRQRTHRRRVSFLGEQHSAAPVGDRKVSAFLVRRRATQPGGQQRNGEDPRDDHEGCPGRKVDPLVEQHLQADEDEDRREPRLEVAQPRQRPPYDEVEAPQTAITQWKVRTSATPARMRVPRSTMAPRTPQKRTRCWCRGGMAKLRKRRTKTNRLSTESDFSSRYPAKYSSPCSPPYLNQT